MSFSIYAARLARAAYCRRWVPELMNQVLSDMGEGESDAFRAVAARRVFKRTEW